MIKTFYIVPAFSDQGGQCRIVSFDGECKSPGDSYRAKPELWKEAGLMNSRGKIVWLDATYDIIDDVKSCEPLMAGTTFVYDLDKPINKIGN